MSALLSELRIDNTWHFIKTIWRLLSIIANTTVQSKLQDEEQNHMNAFHLHNSINSHEILCSPLASQANQYPL